MSNIRGKKLKSVLQSRWLVVTLVAIFLSTNIQFGTPYVSASDAGVRSVVTPDPATATLLTGNLQPVTTALDYQTDPHVDCNLVAYTNLDNGWPKVKYFNLLTNTDAFIPTPVVESFLPDVSGARIAFTGLSLEAEGTRVASDIVVFDASTNTSIVIPGEANHRNSTIGGDLVAFESRADFFPIDQSEIKVYDLATGTLTQLTNDSMRNYDPAVAPTGNGLAFQKCNTENANCDIYSAVRTASGVFSISQLTGPAAEETNADTNGALVVYESLSGGDKNIAYQPIGGGAETQIVLPLAQQNPSIAGNLISFESRVSTDPFDGFEILVFDTSTNRLYRPATPIAPAILNDIGFCAGEFRIVYAAPEVENDDIDVVAFTFQLPESTSDEIESLIALVRSFELKDGNENSLISKLELALDALDGGDTATACDSLAGFVNEVQAQSGKKIPAVQADQLINSANQIKQALGCQ